MTMQLLLLCEQTPPELDISRGKSNAFSKDAHERLKPRKAEQRERVYQYFKGHAYRTLEECADDLRMPVNRVSGRITELKRDGRLIPCGTGKTRSGASCAMYRCAKESERT